MKKAIVSRMLVPSLLIAIGCSSSYEVSSSANGDPSFETFNADASDRRVVIVFQGDKELDARSVVASTDSTRFLIESTGFTIVVPTHTIKKVAFKSYGAGFVDGLLWGARIGGVFGIIWGMAEGLSSGGFNLPVFLAACASTGLIGGLIGLGIGHRYEYRFPTIESTRQ